MDTVHAGEDESSSAPASSKAEEAHGVARDLPSASAPSSWLLALQCCISHMPFSMSTPKGSCLCVGEVVVNTTYHQRQEQYLRLQQSVTPSQAPFLSWATFKE